MSMSQPSPSENQDEKVTLRARVVELERENDLHKQAPRAHAEAGGGLQTSGTEQTPELGSLREIYGTAPIGLCCFDKKLRYVFVNEWLAAINGLSVEEHLGRPISEVLPDVAAGVEAQLRGVMETGEPVMGGTVEAETAAQPGVRRNFEHHYEAVRSADGAIVGVSCVVQDVTERKRAEEALRLIVEGTSWAFGEDFFRSLTRHLALALGVRFAFVSELHEGSEARLRLLAYWEGNGFGENFEYDVEGTPCELVIEKGLAYYPANVQQLFPDDRWLKESRIESYLAVSLLDLEGAPLGHLGVVDDKPMPKSQLAESILRIFAARAGAELLHKRAETLLRHTQFAVEHSSENIYWVRSDGRITYANKTACQALGYSFEELVSMSVPDIDPDFPQEAWPAQFAKMKKAGSMTFEAHDRTKEGRIVPVEILSNYLEFEGEEYVCAFVRDISERKRAEAELKRFRAALDICADAVLLIDRSEMRFTDVNDTACRILGYSREELLRLGPHDVQPEYTKEELERRLDQVIQSEAEPSALEIIHQRKDGSQFPAEVSMRPLEIGDKHYLLAVVRDITERKRAEEQARRLQADLAHMSRLGSIGEMATGLAHELNQPLTVITNYAQGCVRRLKSNTISQDELENILSRIATQARRSGSIIRSLGNFVRKSSALRTNIDVNQSILDVAELVNAEAAQHRVKARFELEPNLPPVKVDQTQLQQVILNLVQNGCEAIEDAPESRREVTVRTKQRDDSYLEIVVSDCGAGIPEALGERLFEPFVTTKAHGIGMGLAI
ncbi:MAG: PAS domain S-box protein, partial [Deltaproteobacteria bacterium]|nr:PAS domain S-box protein [Deltaproteobacteria bacterium]